MCTFHGIQVYEILDNGNLLNAVYTNTGLKKGQSRNHEKDKKCDETEEGYFIDSEIARKKEWDDQGVEGDYYCRYIESANNNVVESCDLNITKCDSVYTFKWMQDGKLIWKGLGLMSGLTHIAVSYIKP